MKYLACENSSEIQEYLFKSGYQWYTHGKKVLFLNRPILYVPITGEKILSWNDSVSALAEMIENGTTRLVTHTEIHKLIHNEI